MELLPEVPLKGFRAYDSAHPSEAAVVASPALTGSVDSGHSPGLYHQVEHRVEEAS